MKKTLCLLWLLQVYSIHAAEHPVDRTALQQMPAHELLDAHRQEMLTKRMQFRDAAIAETSDTRMRRLVEQRAKEERALQEKHDLQRTAAMVDPSGLDLVEQKAQAHMRNYRLQHSLDDYQLLGLKNTEVYTQSKLDQAEAQALGKYEEHFNEQIGMYPEQRQEFSKAKELMQQELEHAKQRIIQDEKEYAQRRIQELKQSAEYRQLEQYPSLERIHDFVASHKRVEFIADSIAKDEFDRGLDQLEQELLSKRDVALQERKDLVPEFVKQGLSKQELDRLVVFMHESRMDIEQMLNSMESNDDIAATVADRVLSDQALLRLVQKPVVKKYFKMIFDTRPVWEQRAITRVIKQKFRASRAKRMAKIAVPTLILVVGSVMAGVFSEK